MTGDLGRLERPQAMNRRSCTTVFRLRRSGLSQNGGNKDRLILENLMHGPIYICWS